MVCVRRTSFAKDAARGFTWTRATDGREGFGWIIDSIPARGKENDPKVTDCQLVKGKGQASSDLFKGWPHKSDNLARDPAAGYMYLIWKTDADPQ